MRFSKSDMQKILDNYNLGDFKKFGEIAKDDVISLSQTVYTSKKKIFMKVFNVREEEILQSLKVASILKNKGYPVFEIFLTKNMKPTFHYKKHPMALLEHINIPIIDDWPNISTDQMKDYAKQLAQFHILTKKMKLNPTFAGSHKDISQLINKFHKRSKHLPLFAQNTLSFMKKEMPKLKCKKGEYKSGYYSEYNPGHVYFKKSKVKYVIDWEIGHDYSYYDFGSSSIACFIRERLSYEKLKIFIMNYNKIRKLSNWERNHIFEAVMFGACKYNVWNLIDLKKGDMKNPNKVKNSNLAQIHYLMDITKEEFYRKL